MDDDFQNALMTELGVEPETPPVETPPVETPPVEEPPKEEPPKEEPPVETPPVEEPSKEETPEEKADREAKEAAATAAAPIEESKPLTAEDIAALLDSRDQASTERINQVKETRQQVLDKTYPQGVDTKIYDSNGKVIETAQDIVDRGLINERTGEAYTYEEAASFMIEAGRQMTKNVEELNEWAEGIAEKNVSLNEGNRRVMEKWGDIIKNTLTKEQRETLASTYITKQLKFDKTGSYVTDVAMSPMEFYDIALAPYKQFADQQAKATEDAEAKRIADEKAAKEAAERQQQERTGSIPPQRGTSDVKANTGNEFTDALIDELRKG